MKPQKVEVCGVESAADSPAWIGLVPGNFLFIHSGHKKFKIGSGSR